MDETTQDKYMTDWFVELILTKGSQELNKAQEQLTKFYGQPNRKAPADQDRS